METIEHTVGAANARGDGPETEVATASAGDTARLQRKRMDRVAFIAAAGLALCFAGVMARVVQLQVRPSERLASFMSDRQTKVSIPAVRGDIVDARGRLLAGTQFGQRAFVDPLRFPNPPGEAIFAVAKVLGRPPEELAKEIVPAMERNEKLSKEMPDADPFKDPLPKLSRYVLVSDVLEDDKIEAIKGLRIADKPVPGVHLEVAPVRESPTGVLAASIVGRVDVDHEGQVGAEKMLDKRLDPIDGSLRYVRDASGDPMWVYPGGYRAPARGADVRLSIDLEIQRIVREEVSRGVLDADAAGARCVVLDPYTGELLAMVDIVRDVPNAKPYDWKHVIPKGGDGVRYRIIRPDPLAHFGPDMARNRCVEDVYEPGSTFKPFMWASALEAGVVRADEWFDTHDGQWRTPYGRPLEDVTKLSRQTWKDILVNSSNIGMVQGVSRMEFPQTRRAIMEFGFGSPTRIGMPGESPGIVTGDKGWSKYTQTSVSMGYEVAVTPLQMARAFAAFCRTGELAGTVPSIRLTAAELESGSQPKIDPGVRAVPASVAELTRETMRGVTHNLDNRLANRTGTAKETFLYEAFGKSGTARATLGKAPEGMRKPKGADGYYGGQYNVSFIAGAPASNPRIVVLVVVDDPGPELVRTKRYYGAMVAGPINRRITERVLGYLRVPPCEKPADAVAAARD